MAFINKSSFPKSEFESLITLAHEASRMHLSSYDKLRSRNLKRHVGMRSFIADRINDINIKQSESYAQWHLQSILPDILSALVHRGILVKHNPTGNNMHVYYTLQKNSLSPTV